jgi:hypothetical protein
VKHRLGDRALGRVAIGDLMRDVRGEDTPVRVALSTLEEAGLLRRHRDTPRTAVVRLRDGHLKEEAEQARDQARHDWSAFVTAARLRRGQPLPLDPISVAQAAGLDPVGIETSLLTWVEAGWIDYRPAGRELLLELIPPPADATSRVEALIDRYATIQVQRVDEIATYGATRRCRHGHISAYLGGKPLDACQACDNCQPDASPVVKSGAALDLPDEREQLQTILRCVSNASGGWGRANLMYILRGSERASQRGKESPEWSALGYRSRAAVEELTERLIGAGFLRARQLGHGGVTLELAPSGRAAIKDPIRLQPLVSKPRPSSAGEKPQRDDDADASVDEALLEQLVTWQRKTAKAAKLPPHFVAHYSLLRRIAAIKPHDESELARIKGMGPKKLEQYSAAILALVRGETIDEEKP